MIKQVFIIVLLFLSYAAQAQENGLLQFKSEHTVAQTVSHLKQQLKQKQFVIFNHINHAKAANKNNISLRDTQLIIFGNPKIGSHLMQCSQSAAIDLPQKALIWKDSKGVVWLAFNNPEYLAARHSLSSCNTLVQKISSALNSIGKQVTQTKKEQP